MKKIALKILSLGLAVCSVFSLFACEKECVHDFRRVSMKENTCISDGAFTFECAKCGESYQTIVEKKGHVYRENKREGYACTGEVIYNLCINCGDEIVEQIEGKGHDFIDGKCDCGLEIENY